MTIPGATENGLWEKWNFLQMKGIISPTAAGLFHLSGDGVQYQSARTEDEEVL